MKGGGRFLLGAVLGAALAYALVLMFYPSTLSRRARVLRMRPRETVEAPEEELVA